MGESSRDILERRLRRPELGLIGVTTDLVHFAIVTFAADAARLREIIKSDRFRVPEFDFAGGAGALVSAVVFLDVDFHAPRVSHEPAFTFGQTNYRAYVIDRETGEHVVWFFRSTLGSRMAIVPRLVWRMPWVFADYRFECDYDRESGRYRRYHVVANTLTDTLEVDVDDTGEPPRALDGFREADDFWLVLTHPVRGFFRRLDGRLGTYTIWHDRLPLTLARPKRIDVPFYSELGLVDESRMRAPHSVLLCPRTRFDVHLPPALLGT